MTTRPNAKGGRSKAPERTWGANPLAQCKRLVISFLQGLFAQAPKGHFKWSEDINASEIFITGSNPIRVEEIGSKPCINVSRSPVQFAGLFIDDFQHYYYSNAQTVQSDLLSGNMAINCLARHAAEAEYIAWVCARHLWVFRKKLIKQGFLEIGRKLNVTTATAAGALVAGKNTSTWRKVTVVSPFHFRYADKIQPTDLSKFNHLEATVAISSPSKETHTPIATRVGSSIVGVYEEGEDIPRTTGYSKSSPELQDDEKETRTIRVGD